MKDGQNKYDITDDFKVSCPSPLPSCLIKWSDRQTN